MLREPAGKDACATEAVAAAVKAVIDRLQLELKVIEKTVSSATS